MPPEAAYDLAKKHPLLPHPEVTKLYKENEFTYQPDLQDRNYKNWYDEVKRSKITILIYQMFRTKRVRDGRSKEFVYYDAYLYGTDRKGNRAPFSIRMGRYERPEFRTDLDERTDKVISKEVVQKTMTHDIPWSAATFDKLLEQSVDEDLKLSVVTQGKTYTISDIDEFRNATFLELVEIGKTYTINDIDEFRNATFAELLEIGKTGQSLTAVRGPAAHQVAAALREKEIRTVGTQAAEPDKPLQAPATKK